MEYECPVRARVLRKIEYSKKVYCVLSIACCLTLDHTGNGIAEFTQRRLNLTPQEKIAISRLVKNVISIYKKLTECRNFVLFNFF